MRRFAALILIWLPVTAFGQDLLCPPSRPAPEGVDDLAMHEHEFTLDKAQDSVTFLKTDFANRIWGPEPVKDFSAWSGHYISYANSLGFIEGALLREHALRLRAEATAQSDPKSAS